MRVRRIRSSPESINEPTHHHIGVESQEFLTDMAASLSTYVWGSFERNTATWCPYPDQAAVESAFQSNERTVFLPSCFNATVHFQAPPQQAHYQLTPAVGSKPIGFRSVMRAVPGDAVTVYWHTQEFLWRLEKPSSRPGESLLQRERRCAARREVC